jgi:menaquinone-dependent protoporphyrinogen oxidase
MTAQTSRRRFLKTGCLTTAAGAIVLCGGGAAVATYQPPVEKPEETFGANTMNKRILITYATKAGSTAEIAARIGEIIAQKGVAVDLLPVSKVNDLTPYQAVVVGSVIRVGSVLPEVKTFIEKNQSTLSQKPFSLFIGCMTLAEDTAENRKTVSAYLDPIRALVKPASEGLFAGVMNLKKLPLFERLMIKMMKAPEGDFRNWDQISAWAESVPLN